MPTARIEEIKQYHVPKYFHGDHYVKPVYISVFRSRIVTEVWKETEGEPQSIRRAKAFARYLDTVPIFIRKGELIVGHYAEDPNVIPNCIEAMDPRIVRNYINAGFVKADEIDEWNQLLPYWEKHGLKALLDSMLTEDEKWIASKKFRYMEVLPTEYTSRTQPDHDLYMKTGLSNILKMLGEKQVELTEERKECVGGSEAVEIAQQMNEIKAMSITIEAVICWANRYSKLAKEMAEKEQDLERGKELMKLSEICGHVPANPPRSFWESLQCHWFMFLAYHVIEHLCHGTSLRTDQIFWPWYEEDVLIEKTLPRERALELMENFLLHVDELGRPLPVHWRTSLQGVNYLATYTIGGVKPEDGSDASNELTILILDALDDLRMNHPDFKFRWHPNLNPKVYRRLVEVVRSGLGQPSIKNDPVTIDYLMDHYGFTLEEARSWAVVGCISPAPTIHWGRSRRDAWTIYPAKYMEMALFNGVDPATSIIAGDDYPEPRQVGPQTGDGTKFKSFDELCQAFRKQIAFGMTTSARIKTIAEHCNSILLKRPFASCLFRRSLDVYRDIMDVREKGMPWVNDPGIIDSVDSLISLKKLVFDDKKYTMEEVLKALRANWEGYEEMRRDFVNAPKFGNNDDHADEVAVRTYRMIAEEMSKVKDINNTSPMPSGLIITWMFQCAPMTGALPNGRKQGDYLADGGINPHAGYDRNGPMAAILSASKVDSRKQKANIFNQKLTPASVAGEAGLRKFGDYINTAMNLGLDLIQFNIVDAATLRDAQAHPEKYANLVVRVSGYNAHFVELDKFVQDAVIERTEHVLV